MRESRKSSVFPKFLKIGGKVGFIITIANLLGPVAWKSVLVGMVVREHLLLKHSLKITDSTPLRYYTFSNKKESMFLTYDFRLKDNNNYNKNSVKKFKKEKVI